jgi:hypothetical protein
VKELDLANPKTSADDPPGVIIQEFFSPTNSITELGQTKSVSPVGAESPQSHRKTMSMSRDAETVKLIGVPDGIRTHVIAVKERCRGPLVLWWALIVSEEDGSRFSRMPNHAMRLHDWAPRV